MTSDRNQYYFGRAAYDTTEILFYLSAASLDGVRFSHVCYVFLHSSIDLYVDIYYFLLYVIL